MQYNGTEKQVTWANEIISIDALEEKLNEMVNTIQTLPEKASRRGRSMTATQKEYFTKKINKLLEHGFGADAVIENRVNINTVSGLEKAIGYADAPGIGNVIWVMTKTDADFKAAL